jgi:hypothetical protein
VLNYSDQFNIQFHYMFRCVFSVTKVRNSRTQGTGIISCNTLHAVVNKLEMGDRSDSQVVIPHISTGKLIVVIGTLVQNNDSLQSNK